MNRLVMTLIAFLALAIPALGQSCGSSYSRSYGYSYNRTYTPSYSYSYATPTYSYVAPTYVAPVKKEYKEDYVPTVFALALPVAILPAYGATYAPALQSQQPLQQTQQSRGSEQASQMQQILTAQTQILEAVKKLDERTARIELRVEKLERTRTPLAQPKQEEGPVPKLDSNEVLTKEFIQVNTDSCAACHSRSNAEKHGGKFVFSEDDGQLARLTAEQRDEVERQMRDGTMPKIGTARAKEMGVKPLTQQTADVLFKALDRQKFATRKKG